MKNYTNIYKIIITFIAAMAIFSCPTENGGGEVTAGGDPDLSGIIQILLFGEPVGPDNPASTRNTLVADYDGDEEVTYQWNFGTAIVGTARTYVPDDPGVYTVTVSAPGYKSKTSAPVTVEGQPTPELSGTLTIQVNGAAVTTAQTGDVLTAVYSGSENVSFRWFKDGVGITSSSSTTYTTYTPTEEGSYTVSANLSNYRAMMSNPVVVSGTTLITITFNRNDGGYDHPTRAVAPGVAIGDLPSAPVRNGFTFDGWYFRQTDDEGIVEWLNEVFVTTVFDEATTVYAKWNFTGGTPVINAEEDTLVHENPLMEAGNGFAGTISTEDGAISYTAGAFQYKFPTGDDFDISDYAYCIARYELSSESGSGSGVFLRQYGNSTTYGGVSNQYPWLSNGSSFRFPISGAGTTGGFSIGYNGGTTTIEVRIISVTFYKLPLYTVTFDLDGGTGTVPADGVTLYEGDTLGAQFPANPTKEGYTFTGWQNAAETVVTATTPIMGDWALTAQWMLTSEVPSPVDEVAENETLFAASAGSAATPFTYDGKQWWVFAKTPPGTPAAVAPFDGDAAEVYTTALAAATANYTRVSYNLPALSDMWQSFPKVMVTYDLIVVGGSELTLTVRNGVGAGGEPNVLENQTVEAGFGKTISFNTSAIGTGNLAFVKRNSGTDSLFLLRITKVELLME